MASKKLAQPDIRKGTKTQSFSVEGRLLQQICLCLLESNIMARISVKGVSNILAYNHNPLQALDIMDKGHDDDFQGRPAGRSPPKTPNHDAPRYTSSAAQYHGHTRQLPASPSAISEGEAEQEHPSSGQGLARRSHSAGSLGGGPQRGPGREGSSGQNGVLPQANEAAGPQSNAFSSDLKHVV